MQKRTTIILLTILCWGLIVGFYAYEFVSSGMRHPAALSHVPVDLEAVALERIWYIQLGGFAMTRFPFLLGALVLALLVERKVFRPQE